MKTHEVQEVALEVGLDRPWVESHIEQVRQIIEIARAYERRRCADDVRRMAHDSHSSEGGYMEVPNEDGVPTHVLSGPNATLIANEIADALLFQGDFTEDISVNNTASA